MRRMFTIILIVISILFCPIYTPVLATEEMPIEELERNGTQQGSPEDEDDDFLLDTTILLISLIRQPPTITVDPEHVVLELGSTYSDEGVTAWHSTEHDLTNNIIAVGEVNVNQLGIYTRTFDVSNKHGDAAKQGVREVEIISQIPPVLTLNGEIHIEMERGVPFADPWVNATSTVDDDTWLTNQVVRTGSVNHDVPGTYTLLYNVSDSRGLAAEERVRTVEVLCGVTPLPPKPELYAPENFSTIYSSPFTQYTLGFIWDDELMPDPSGYRMEMWNEDKKIGASVNISRHHCTMRDPPEVSTCELLTPINTTLLEGLVWWTITAENCSGSEQTKRWFQVD